MLSGEKYQKKDLQRALLVLKCIKKCPTYTIFRNFERLFVDRRAMILMTPITWSKYNMHIHILLVASLTHGTSLLGTAVGQLWGNKLGMVHSKSSNRVFGKIMVSKCEELEDNFFWQ